MNNVNRVVADTAADNYDDDDDDFHRQADWSEKWAHKLPAQLFCCVLLLQSSSVCKTHARRIHSIIYVCMWGACDARLLYGNLHIFFMCSRVSFHWREASSCVREQKHRAECRCIFFTIMWRHQITMLRTHTETIAPLTLRGH